LQNHYNYVFDNITNTYNFVTRNSILYRVAFVVDETFSAISGETIPNMFQLVVEKATETLESYDAKVSKTIEDIVEKFFQTVENSLIYICSDDDKKSKLRHDIFDRWYKNSPYHHAIIKLDNIISFNLGDQETQKLYTSMMFHRDNSNSKKIIHIYTQISSALLDEK